MISRGPSAYQTSYRLACEVLRRILGTLWSPGPGSFPKAPGPVMFYSRHER